MKQKRHTPEQIIAKLREAEAVLSAGGTIAQVVQQIGDLLQVRCWRNRYGGMKASDAQRLKFLFTALTIKFFSAVLCVSSAALCVQYAFCQPLTQRYAEQTQRAAEIDFIDRRFRLPPTRNLVSAVSL